MTQYGNRFVPAVCASAKVSVAGGLLWPPAPMVDNDDRSLISQLIKCILKNGDDEICKQVKEELKLLLNYWRFKKRRKTIVLH